MKQWQREVEGYINISFHIHDTDYIFFFFAENRIYKLIYQRNLNFVSLQLYIQYNTLYLYTPQNPTTRLQIKVSATFKKKREEVVRKIQKRFSILFFLLVCWNSQKTIIILVQTVPRYKQTAKKQKRSKTATTTTTKKCSDIFVTAQIYKKHTRHVVQIITYSDVLHLQQCWPRVGKSTEDYSYD